MQASEAAAESAEGVVGTDVAAREILAFRLGPEEYGIDILKVQEIRGCDAVTTLANSPAFIKGVINLRGVIVPIVDLRIRFGLGEAVYNEFTVVIVLNLGSRIVGVVVDGVSDVLTLGPDQIKQAPALAAGVGLDCMTGLGSIEERMLILIDIQKLMLSPGMALEDARD